MSQEKMRSMIEIIEEFTKMEALSEGNHTYEAVYRSCAIFYRWLFYVSEIKLSELMEEDRYWSREVGEC